MWDKPPKAKQKVISYIPKSNLYVPLKTQWPALAGNSFT